MDTQVYICTGGCGAVISQKQYDEGLQACGADGCDHKGVAFEKRKQCASCKKNYKEETGHVCE